MNPSIFFDNFSLLADSPNGVQKLREMILQLAVMGKLVEQDDRDEPAEKIIYETYKLPSNSKRLKKQIKKTPLCFPDEIFPEIPSSWVYSTIKDLYDKKIIIDYGDGNHGSLYPRKSDFEDEGVTFVTAKQVNKGKVDWDECQFLNELKSQQLTKGWSQGGDVLLTHNATVGRVARVEKDMHSFLLGTSVTFYRLNEHVLNSDYFYLYLLSPLWQNQLNRVMQQTTRNQVSIQKQAFFKVAIPPLEEQKRIVAKVDQLMTLCDELEALHQHRNENRVHLNIAAINKLLDAGSVNEFNELWQLIYNNFDLLYDNLDNVAKLRQGILQLAVQGKLVPQNPNDEPASMLLKKIREEKEKLVKEGNLKQVNDFVPIESDDKKFDVPEKWEWVRFGEITFCRDGERIPISREERDTRRGQYDYYGASGIIDKIDGYLFDKSLLLIGEDGANLVLRSTPIAFIAHGKYWVNNHAHVLDGISLEFLQYIELYINATDLKPYITGTAQPKMNQSKMNSIPVALPPLEEQKRIVVKVDQLMTLCDELEMRIRKSQEDGEKITNAVVSNLTAI